MKIKEKDGKIFFVSSKAFKVDFIKNRFNVNIEAVLRSQGIEKPVCICDEATFENTITIRQRDTTNVAESRIYIADAIQSLVKGRRSQEGPEKPEISEDLSDILEHNIYHTAPSIRNALLKATERFANSA